MKYTNQYGESIQILANDEIWLDDTFFAREMAALPSDAPRAGLAYRVSTKGQVDHDDIPMLDRLIAKAEVELRVARQEHAKVLQEVEDDRELNQKIKECYREFCGWAEEFELASLARKRIILSELLEKVEVGKGYQVTVHVKLVYKQFRELCQINENDKISLRNATDAKMA